MAAHAHERRAAVLFIAVFDKYAVDRRRDIARRRARPGRFHPQTHRLVKNRVFLPHHRRRLAQHHRAANLHEQAADARRDLTDDDVARLDDAIGRRMERLIMVVGHHHAEIVFGAEVAHAVLDDGGQLVLLQTRPRVLVQRLNPGVGDRRRAPETLQLEGALRPGDGFDDVLGVDRRRSESFDDLIVEFHLHGLAADQAGLARKRREARPQLLDRADIGDP